ncbi:hypothetical protein HDU96_002752, partial [Phlyctochytrium bullatum]
MVKEGGAVASASEAATGGASWTGLATATLSSNGVTEARQRATRAGKGGRGNRLQPGDEELNIPFLDDKDKGTLAEDALESLGSCGDGDSLRRGVALAARKERQRRQEWAQLEPADGALGQGHGRGGMWSKEVRLEEEEDDSEDEETSASARSEAKCMRARPQSTEATSARRRGAVPVAGRGAGRASKDEGIAGRGKAYAEGKTGAAASGADNADGGGGCTRAGRRWCCHLDVTKAGAVPR